MIEAFEGDLPTIHDEAYVHPSAVIIGRVSIGARSSIWPNVTLRGDDGWIEIGDETSIQDGSVVHMTEGQSNTRVGSRVTVGHNVTLHGCTIGDGTVIGMGAIILDNAVVEAGAFVAAGTVVPPGKRVPTGKLAMGNPFVLKRDLTDSDRDWLASGWQTYVQRVMQYKKQHDS